MRKVLLSIMIGLVATAMASAYPVCTAGDNVLAGGYACDLGGLTFSNFSAQAVTGTFTPNVTLGGASVVGDDVYLTFNPNMAATSQALDMYFWFQVTGYVLGVDLYNGGQGITSIGETVCSDPFSGIACNDTSLATMTANTGDPRMVRYFTPDDSIYIWKDIYVEYDPTGENSGHLTGFEQSFHTPEPMTFVLIGTGLLGLGILGRRRASK